MELIHILDKNIPKRKEIIACLKKKPSYNISKLCMFIIKKTKKWCNDIRVLNAFFIELFDMLYYYVVCKDVSINKKLFKLLESLALPIEYVGEKQWKWYFKKLQKIKP